MENNVSEEAPVFESLPEKARVLESLKEGGFDVPDFIYVPATDFENENFEALEAFLDNHRQSFKVIARSAHPQEEFFKGGTFDSLETYADLGGIQYARKHVIKCAQTTKALSIRRQQRFANAPDVDPDKMGIIVMPFIEGSSVMAKIMGDCWEFGYCRSMSHKVQSEPYITTTPHDGRLLQLSEDIQYHLGFRCEIEYIMATDGDIYVVQAKDISTIETLEKRESERSVELDGVRRIRKKRNYRERPIYVMDNNQIYIDIIGKCEDIVHGCEGPTPNIKDVIGIITDYEAELEMFALMHGRFAVLGLSIQDDNQLYQVANQYLDDFPELQAQLSAALRESQYKIDVFLSEADTLISKNRFRISLCSHDAYGIDTVRYPVWSVYWNAHRHDYALKEFKRLGFKTGDSVGIDIDAEGKPAVFRL
ncbi:MAG: hypothetical protein BAW33_07640 [Desulfobacterales bacterium C00003104]|jgi:hypothetical protein|nr:MAG: hypothetical protein BAW33_07640 [Desulfobacterales bacterium C00003104]